MCYSKIRHWKNIILSTLRRSGRRFAVGAWQGTPFALIIHCPGFWQDWFKFSLQKRRSEFEVRL